MANGVPSTFTLNPGSTNESRSTGSVETKGTPTARSVMAWRLPDGRSSRVMAASEIRMLFSENRGVVASGGGGVEGPAARRAKMSEKL